VWCCSIKAQVSALEHLKSLLRERQALEARILKQYEKLQPALNIFATELDAVIEGRIDDLNQLSQLNQSED
jgi:hypothetical protein